MSHLLRTVLAALACIALSFGTASAIGKVADKWRLQISGGSWKGGMIVMHFVEQDAVVTKVTITIPKITGENKIARLIRDQLKAGLPKNKFHVEVDDTEDVLVKAQEDVKDFELAIVRNTADGTEVTVDRE